MQEKTRFVWDIHYKCNYRCPYCWFYNRWADSGRFNKYFSFDAWAAAWDRIFDLYGASFIDITGGEPFLYPDFCRLLKHLSGKHRVRITTNLSVSAPALESYIADMDNSKVSFEISFHPTFAKIDQFLEKAEILKDKGFCNRLQFVAYPPQLRLMRHFEERARQKGLSLSVTAFWGAHRDKKYPEGYTQEQKDMLKQYINNLERFNLVVEKSSNRGKMCCAGNKFALIRANGEVVRCGQANPKESMGNFLNPAFFLNEGPSPCTYEYCPCNEYMPA